MLTASSQFDYDFRSSNEGSNVFVDITWLFISPQSIIPGSLLSESKTIFLRDGIMAL
jgi:hypothetical protein